MIKTVLFVFFRMASIYSNYLIITPLVAPHYYGSVALKVSPLRGFMVSLTMKLITSTTVKLVRH